MGGDHLAVEKQTSTASDVRESNGIAVLVVASSSQFGSLSIASLAVSVSFWLLLLVDDAAFAFYLVYAC